MSFFAKRPRRIVGSIVAVALAAADSTTHADVGFSGVHLSFDIPNAVLISDLNGDGKPELIGADANGVCIQSADFAPGSIDYAEAFTQMRQCFGAGSAYAAAAVVVDLNGDGLPDIVTANQSAGVGSVGASLSLLINASTPGGDIAFAGGGIFVPPPSVDVGRYPYSIATADFNCDGKPDLATANLVDNTISVLLNTTAQRSMQASFALQTVLGAPSSPFLVVAADLNGDGKPDLLVSGSGTVAVLFNTTPAGASVPSFTAAAPIASSTSQYAFPTLAVADLDGDGSTDVAVPNGDGTLSVLLNRTARGAMQPNFVARSAPTPGLNVYTVLASDIDGDGRPDLLVLSNDNRISHVTVSRNLSLPSTGYAGFASQTFQFGINPGNLVVGDVNADGKADVVIADYGNFGQGDGGVDLLLNITGLAYANLDQQGLTGSWFDPETGGQGLEIEVFPDLSAPGRGLLTGGWFTYDTSGGERRWYALSGDVSARNPIAQIAVYLKVEGTFDTPPQQGLQPIVIGGATIQFSDCNHAQFHYVIEDNFGTAANQELSGIIPLTRLVPQSNCTLSGSGAAPAPTSLLSGNWFNPATSGQGFIFDVSPSSKTLFAAWYTFDVAGTGSLYGATQNWFTLQSAFTDASASLKDIAIVETAGGAFDDPVPTQSAQVGSAEIVFQDCGTMTLTYRFDAGSNIGHTGTIPLQRVGPTPAGCARK